MSLCLFRPKFSKHKAFVMRSGQPSCGKFRFCICPSVWFTLLLCPCSDHLDFSVRPLQRFFQFPALQSSPTTFPTFSIFSSVKVILLYQVIYLPKAFIMAFKALPNLSPPPTQLRTYRAWGQTAWWNHSGGIPFHCLLLQPVRWPSFLSGLHSFILGTLPCPTRYILHLICLECGLEIGETEDAVRWEVTEKVTSFGNPLTLVLNTYLG